MNIVTVSEYKLMRILLHILSDVIACGAGPSRVTRQCALCAYVFVSRYLCILSLGLMHGIYIAVFCPLYWSVVAYIRVEVWLQSEYTVCLSKDKWNWILDFGYLISILDQTLSLNLKWLILTYILTYIGTA